MSFIFTLFLGAASADVLPPRNYVERCTVESMCAPPKDGTTCEGYHGGREPCEALEAQGYKKVCRTRGASVWTEVMCRPKVPGAKTMPEVDKKTPDKVPAKSPRCSTTQGQFGWLGLFGVLALSRRRLG